MEILGIVNGFIHIMAVALVLGGEFFMMTVVDKATAQIPPPDRGRIKEMVGKGFTMIAWGATVAVIVTGVARSAAMGLFSSEVLLESTYGNLLLLKLALFAVILFNAVRITKTAISMSALAAQTPPPVEEMQAKEGKIHKWSLTNLVLTSVVVLIAVATRFIGAPTV